MCIYIYMCMYMNVYKYMHMYVYVYVYGYTYSCGLVGCRVAELACASFVHRVVRTAYRVSDVEDPRGAALGA